MPAAVATALVTESAIFVVCAPEVCAVCLTFFTAARAAVVNFFASRFTRVTTRFAPLLPRAAPRRADDAREVDRDFERLTDDDLRPDDARLPPVFFFPLPPLRPAARPRFAPFLAIGSFRLEMRLMFLPYFARDGRKNSEKSTSSPHRVGRFAARMVAIKTKVVHAEP